MRDVHRVEPVLARLGEVWTKAPDLRLGQLLIAIAGTRDPFQIEEDEWLQLIDAFEATLETGP